MWIQARQISGAGRTIRLDGLSKLSKVEMVRGKLLTEFDGVLEPGQLRMFFRGKQMEDGHSLYDYDVGLNDLIQILIRKNVQETLLENEDKLKEDSADDGSTSDKENKEPSEAAQLPTTSEQERLGSSIYKVGDIVDARDTTMGAWFEARIMKVEHGIDEDIKGRLGNSLTLVHQAIESSSQQSQVREEGHMGIVTRHSDDVARYQSLTEQLSPLNFGAPDGFTYCICFEKYPDDVLKVLSTEIRPRARTLIRFLDVEVGQHIMANYNYEEPETRGFWYDCVVTGKKDTRTIKELTASVYIGAELTPLKNCHLIFTRELFGIETPGTQLTEEDIATDPSASFGQRQNKPECGHCQDSLKKKCKYCGCVVCGDKKDPEKTILCDECNEAYHLYCLNPALGSVPQEDEWYCPECKNDETAIVRIGEKLKVNKKKAKMASANSSSGRDWGKGMACVGRSKMCTIVSSNHYGPIPGVDVGTMWKFRVQVSEAGVHRPHVAGIHGREEDGAYSIVLSGGYEDDADDGEEFYYTGSGGRDLSGNKRTAEQSCDQTLTRMNKALAKNCNSPLDSIKGTEAKDWQGGKPVRVVRNCKGRKHSVYAPKEGNRYDGIYKVVKYWPEKGKSSFLVWRYLLRRDDLTPAPWTNAGQKRIGDLGLKMQYPDGYLESLQQKEAAKDKEDETEVEATPGKKSRKRKSEGQPHDPKKKSKADILETEGTTSEVARYSLETGTKKLIAGDKINKKLWDEALTTVAGGSKVFHDKVEELFLCICCQELVCKPITLRCAHNICTSCLQRSFKADVYSCPACRGDLDKNMLMATNKTLTQILNNLFPGYEAGR